MSPAPPKDRRKAAVAALEQGLGQMQGSQWQVLNGLKAGDKVIAEGAMKLKDQGEIKAAPVKPAAAAESNPAGQ